MRITVGERGNRASARRGSSAFRTNLLVTFAVFASVPVAAQAKPDMVWTNSIQSGLADTFQLTLGGTFGNGPAWQNRFTTGVANLFKAGDSVYLYGWNTQDLSDLSNNWQAGIGYKRPVFKKGKHVVSLGSGLQRWLFPSVKSGAKDWLIPGNLVYQTNLRRFGFVVTGDSWTLLKSTLPTGSLLHTQAWVEYPLLRREAVKISFKNGPAHTYSWNFYGTNGNRVIRYQTMLTVAFKSVAIEGGFRKQWGQQSGIQDNNYWQFAVTRTFNRAIL